LPKSDTHLDRQGLTIVQTARVLGLHPQTVATWLARSRFEPRRSRLKKPWLPPALPAAASCRRSGDPAIVCGT
jgi:hypothetical protein